jgi:hypothetical protein
MEVADCSKQGVMMDVLHFCCALEKVRARFGPPPQLHQLLWQACVLATPFYLPQLLRQSHGGAIRLADTRS